MVTAAIERLDALGRLAEPILGTAMTLPPAGFWERRELGRLESLLPRAGHDPLGPLAGEHAFRAMAAAPAALTTALAPSDVGVVTEARAFALARRGLHVLEGGLAALQELLLQRIETFGGERRRRLEPLGVVMRRGRAVGLQVSPRDEKIGCQWLLWAGSSASLRATLGPSAPQVPTRGRPAALRVGGYRYALSLVVAPAAVPPGTPARLLAIADPARPLLEDNAIAVTVGRPGPRESERIPLWIECAVPAHLVDAGPSYLRALRGDCFRRWSGSGPTSPRTPWWSPLRTMASVPSAAKTAPRRRPAPPPRLPWPSSRRRSTRAGRPEPSMSAACRTPRG